MDQGNVHTLNESPWIGIILERPMVGKRVIGSRQTVKQRVEVYKARLSTRMAVSIHGELEGLHHGSRRFE